MKPYIKRILNEARVQRTIDSKIWASMSSSSSKNRATLAVDVKPRSKDDNETLLQKYVAGLLTMKVECPATEADIDKIKAYRLIGHAAINAGVTLSLIQKLYVENGGTFTGEVTDDEPVNDYPSYDEVEVNDEPVNDYPSYDDVTDDDTEELFGNEEEVIDKTKNTHNFDQAVLKIEQKKELLDYPAYDEVETDGKFDNASVNDINRYFKNVKKTVGKANSKDILYWNNDEGLSLNGGTEIAQCAASSYEYIDRQPRFMIVGDEDVLLGNNGNNGVYDDYRYTEKQGMRRLMISPRTVYYKQEEIKGKFYTSILIDNGNVPAQTAVENVNSLRITGELSQAVIDNIKKNAYLPTLPELSKVAAVLPRGRYWTSSIDDNGESNIILQIGPDKVITTENPADTAKVITFISF